jgi:hypothetical protein
MNYISVSIISTFNLGLGFIFKLASDSVVVLITHA